MFMPLPTLPWTGLLCGYIVSYGDGCASSEGPTDSNVVPASDLSSRLSPKRSGSPSSKVGNVTTFYLSYFNF